MPFSNKVEATIAAEGDYTDPIELAGSFNSSVAGSFTGVIAIERKFGVDGDWRTVVEYDAPIEDTGFAAEHEQHVYYRVGAPVGSGFAGSANVRLSK